MSDDVLPLERRPLSFGDLRDANIRRLPQFRDRRGRLSHSEPDGSDWSKAEWLQAVVGELGELANLLKKVRRGDFTEAEAAPEVRRELADVVIYLDILAMQCGVELETAVPEKFDEVSHRVGADVFLAGRRGAPREGVLRYADEGGRIPAQLEEIADRLEAGDGALYPSDVDGARGRLRWVARLFREGRLEARPVERGEPIP